MSFGMADRHQVRAQDAKSDATAQERKPETHSDEKTDDYDDLRLSTSSIIELDRKDLLIVKDGTVRVAESLDREQQQLDANGEVVKASGTWTKAEHERFLRAMETFPKGPWKAIAEMVATRTVRQTQTHAQKYREKLARRMRGLRNRNGTLQTPPMSVGMAPGIVGYPQQFSSSYYQHPGSMGYTVPSHVMTPPMTSMTAPAIPLARATSLLAMPMHSSPFHHHHTSYMSSSMANSVAMVSSEFSQLSTSTISNAFIGNASYPSSWEANAVQAKPTEPDFDESMDFLMDVYSTNPSQINTPQQVTPTACMPRTPQTPMPSLAMKRHPGGYGFMPKHFTLHHDNSVNREQEAKGV